MEREGEAGGPEGTEAEGREVTGDAAVPEPSAVANPPGTDRVPALS